MNKIISAILFVLPLFIKAQSTKITYVNHKGNEVSELAFFNTRVIENCVVGQNENGTKLTLIKNREKTGTLNDYVELVNLINKELNLNLKDSQPLFVCFSPGPDRSNTSSTEISDKDLDHSYKEYQNFEKKLKKEINGQILNVFKKESQFVYENNTRTNWHKDPDNEFEKRFFSDFHYWHSSFVLLYPDGSYYLYFGEFSYDKVFDYIKNKKKNGKKTAI